MSGVYGYVCGSIGALLTFLGIALVIAFPLAIFPFLIRSQLTLGADEDGQFNNMATNYWAKPPLSSSYNFYFFNLTNQDQVMYLGAKPHLQEVGPYSFVEIEEKKNISWRENQDMVWFQNHKWYTFNTTLSCDNCGYNDVVTVPNAAYLTVVQNLNNPLYSSQIPKTMSFLLQVGLLLLGEYPIRTVPVRGILYEGYEDPLITMVNSKLYGYIESFKGGPLLPFPIPNVPAMGYFVNYNGSNDESYYIHTGQKEAEDIGRIAKWANMSLLPESWWGDVYSRGLLGGDGSINQGFLNKSFVLHMFNSFICRSIYLNYDSEKDIRDIPSYRFLLPAEAYDSTKVDNCGFRYANTERRNYFPDWPTCPKEKEEIEKNNGKIEKDGNKLENDGRKQREGRTMDSLMAVASTTTRASTTTTPFMQKGCANKNDHCSLAENFCDANCHGSTVNGVILVPPGMFPLRCFPAKNEPNPFDAFFSEPHFLHAPWQVIESVVGLNPDPDIHAGADFYLEPNSGLTLQAHFRIQLSLPVFPDPTFIASAQLPTKLIPVFWMHALIELQEGVYDSTHTTMVVLPKAATAVFVGITLIGLVILLLSIFCLFRARRKKRENDGITWQESVEVIAGVGH